MVCSGSLVCFGNGFRGELGFGAFLCLTQGSSDFFCEIKRRTRSAKSGPSNGFLNPSLNPSVKVSSPGSSLVKASRIVPWWSGLLRRVLCDLAGFDAAQCHVDNDAVGVKTLSADTRFKTRRRRLDGRSCRFRGDARAERTGAEHRPRQPEPYDKPRLQGRPRAFHAP